MTPFEFQGSRTSSERDSQLDDERGEAGRQTPDAALETRGKSLATGVRRLNETPLFNFKRLRVRVHQRTRFALCSLEYPSKAPPHALETLSFAAAQCFRRCDAPRSSVRAHVDFLILKDTLNYLLLRHSGVSIDLRAWAPYASIECYHWPYGVAGVNSGLRSGWTPVHVLSWVS